MRITRSILAQLSNQSLVHTICMHTYDGICTSSQCDDMLYICTVPADGRDA